MGQVRGRVALAVAGLVGDLLVAAGEGDGLEGGPARPCSWFSMQKSTIGPTLSLFRPFTIVTTGVILMPAAYMLSMAIFFTSKRFEILRWELASLVTPSNCR